MKALQDALGQRCDEYRDAIDRLLNHVENDPEAYDAAHSLREAIHLIGCLRTAVGAMDTDMVYRAFGAPGDFGYGTPIGAALYSLYRAKYEGR